MRISAQFPPLSLSCIVIFHRHHPLPPIQLVVAPRFEAMISVWLPQNVSRLFDRVARIFSNGQSASFQLFRYQIAGVSCKSALMGKYINIQGVPGFSRQAARAYSKGQKEKKMLHEVCELTPCYRDIIKNRYLVFY